MGWQYELQQRLQESDAGLAAAIARLPESAWDRRPADGGWTAREVLEHIALAEALYDRLLETLLAQGEVAAAREAAPGAAPDAGAPAPAKWEAKIVRRFGHRKLEAPEAVVPTGSQSVAESLRSLEETGARIAGALACLQGLDWEHLTYKHPSGFELNAAQFVDLAAWHKARHTRQLLAAAGLTDH